MSKPLRRIDVGLVTKQVTVIDHQATGELMRKARVQIGLSLRDMAARMEFSPPYLSDLELGRRNWTDKLIETWWEAASQE